MAATRAPRATKTKITDRPLSKQKALASAGLGGQSFDLEGFCFFKAAMGRDRRRSAVLARGKGWSGNPTRRARRCKVVEEAGRLPSSCATLGAGWLQN